ncbi:MAG: ExeA family protein [Planctomycetota bacterium]|jgi:general secretion pathway protein A
MYDRHWNLTARPFQNDFDPKMFYSSTVHEEALTRLLYAFSENKGVMLLTGPAGSGKSYIAHLFAMECRRRGFPSAYVAKEKYELVDAIFSHVRSNGGHGLLVLDEVQGLTNPKCLEEVKLLSSLTDGYRKLFTIVLAGGDSFRELIAEDEALAMRIEIAYNLRGLTIEETIQYVTQRLEKAGRRETVFSPDSLESMHAMTGGLPRLLNTICDLSLFAAAGRKLDWVGLEIIEEARGEMLTAIGHRGSE